MAHRVIKNLKFVMIGTFYGFCISNRENFVHKSCANVISHLEHLMPEHKVTILALSFSFLWYERSRAMVVVVVDCFIHDFSKYLESNEEIQELLEHYKVADGIDDADTQTKRIREPTAQLLAWSGFVFPPLPNGLPLWQDHHEN